MKNHFTYKALFAALLLSAVFVFSACGSKNEAPTATEKPMQTEKSAETEAPIESEAQMETEAPMQSEAPEDTTMMEGEKVFTLEELSQYDGKDGNPAYVAVDGVVYDVSDKPLWAGGEHQSRVSAGKDLSEEINSSPHGKSKLNDLPVVGKLAGD